MIEVNGMAHVILTVSQWEKARAFYGELLPFLGLQKVYDGNNFLYHVGGRTAVGIQRCARSTRASRSCRTASACITSAPRALARGCRQGRGQGSAMGAIDRGPMEGDWAPGYYYFVFEDPDGIRLEVNFIPARACSRPTRRSAPATTRLGPESLS